MYVQYEECTSQVYMCRSIVPHHREVYMSPDEELDGKR